MNIYHLTSVKEWRRPKPPACIALPPWKPKVSSTAPPASKWSISAAAYFAGRTDLLLLCIQSGMSFSALRLEGERLWPQIHGPSNLEAVERVVEFPIVP